ncbi:MAG: insulinase family protein [Bacteroidales bacterium]|nr:insulinase family protein [Bacteroidales bacterium]
MDRTTAPDIKQIAEYQPVFPDKKICANNIVSYYFFNPQLDLLHFTIFIRAGKAYSKVKAVAELCYKVLKEHRKEESSAEFAAIVDSLGASFSVNITTETVKFNIIVPKRNCISLLTIIFDLLLHPVFLEKDLETQKQLQIKNWQLAAMKGDTRATQLLFHTFFEKNSPQQKLLSEEIINAVTVEQLISYHKESFCAENILFFGAGNIDLLLQKQIEELLNTIPNYHSLPKISKISHDIVEKNVFEERSDCAQSSILLGKRLLNFTNEQAREFEVLSTILGNYFGSRLMQNLRETHGFTYGISCDFSQFGKDALFYITSEVNAPNTNEALEECYKEMAKLQDELVDDKELQTVKNYLYGKMLRAVDGSVSYMKYFTTCIQLGTDESEYAKQMAVIKNISAKRIQEMAHSFFNREDYSEIVVGKS